MSGMHREGLVVSLVAVACVTPLLSGCSRLAPTFAMGSRRASVPSGEPLPAGQPRREKREMETLSAIEDFLERTKDFRLPGPPESPVAHLPTSRTPSIGPALPMGKSKVTNEEPSSTLGYGAFANTQVLLHDTSADKPELKLPMLLSVSIRAEATPEPHAPKPVETKTTNTPLDVEPGERPMSLERLATTLESRVREANDFDAEWQLRLVRLAMGRDIQAVEMSSKLSEEAHRLLSALCKVAAAVRDVARDPMLTGQDALARVVELGQVLADRADPVVSAVALCRRVVTFGVYDEMTEADFVAGRTTQTILYSEVNNFRSQPTSEGLHETRLATRLELLTADGQSVWQKEEPEIVDLCRRRRTDFFIAQRITLPPTLPAGDYVLKVLVEDTLSGKVSEATRPLTITSPLSVASGS